MKFTNDNRKRQIKVIKNDDGFIFDAIAGFCDWGADLTDKETIPYLCDTSSPIDIKRWFEDIIYPNSNKEKLVEFIHLYKENKTNLFIDALYKFLANCPLKELEKNQDIFFKTVAELITEKLKNNEIHLNKQR